MSAGRYHMHGALEHDGHQVTFTLSVDAPNLEEGSRIIFALLEPWPHITSIDSDEFTRDGQPDIHRTGPRGGNHDRNHQQRG